MTTGFYRIHLNQSLYQLEERKTNNEWKLVNVLLDTDFDNLINNFPLTKKFFEQLDFNNLNEMNFVVVSIVIRLINIGRYQDKFVTWSQPDQLFWYVKVNNPADYPCALKALSILLMS